MPNATKRTTCSCTTRQRLYTYTRTHALLNCTLTHKSAKRIVRLLPHTRRSLGPPPPHAMREPKACATSRVPGSTSLRPVSDEDRAARRWVELSRSHAPSCPLTMRPHWDLLSVCAREVRRCRKPSPVRLRPHSVRAAPAPAQSSTTIVVTTSRILISLGVAISPAPVNSDTNSS